MIDGNIDLAPPPAGSSPGVSAATAFAAARQSWGDPHGTAVPEVVLTSYTNDGQGEVLPDGGIRRFDVKRLVWAVIDSGATCASAGPAGPGHRIWHDCVVISFVDARTGRSRGGMDQFGRGVLVPDFG